MREVVDEWSNSIPGTGLVSEQAIMWLEDEVRQGQTRAERRRQTVDAARESFVLREIICGASSGYHVDLRYMSHR